MSWRGAPPADEPPIPGYEVFRGRTLLHARHEGTAAGARRERRPWHVVGRTVQDLVKAVNGGR